ncbi:MAG: hypothetical protein H7246_00360, partial [Phycisphaerae bacterium]|nr:hypothetical protein [Saprospiraceae bacterium]
GMSSCKIDSSFLFGGGFKESIALGKISKCQLSVFLKGNYGGNVLVVFEVKSGGKNVLWQSLPVTHEMYAPNEWKKIDLGFEIPEAARLGDEAMLYFWLSPNGTGSLFADDAEVSFK